MIKSNNRTGHRTLSLMVLFALIAGSVLPAFGTTQRRRARRRAPVVTRPATPQVQYFTVAANTTIRARMNQQISSGSARVNDRFTATVVDPVYADGKEVVPAGSTVHGRVSSVRRAERRGKAGTLGVEFVTLELPNGDKYTINGSLTNVPDQDSVSDNESTVKGESATKQNVVFIGGGAATGALIGAIAGGGKGAGIGAGVGAGLGVAGALLKKGDEADVKPGTEFGIILNRRLTLPAYNR